MKTNIHPTWYPEARIRCACGNEFTVGSTLPEIHVEVCSRCHPFFTGQTKFIDTAGRVEQFKARTRIIDMTKVSKKERRSLKRKHHLEEELSRPTSLEEIRMK